MSEAAGILNQMLDAVPDSYQKTVLFPTYDILAAAAIPMAELKAAIEAAKMKLDPENLQGDELDSYIQPRTGQVRNQATYAVGVLEVNGTGTVTEGDLFESGGGIQFRATGTVEINGTGSVPVACIQAGSVGNLPAGSITMMPVQIAGIVSVSNLDPTSEGYDAETDAAYLARFYVRVQTPPTSGNQYQYQEWALEVSGVGGVQIFPLGHGDNTVDVVIINVDGEPASEALVQSVQDHIDPGSQGVGAGAAPIGAYCYVSAAEAVPLALSLTVTAVSDADKSQVTQAVKDAVAAYLKAAALAAYQPEAENGYVVSYAQIGAAVLAAAGVSDYEGLTVNGGTTNIEIAVREAATMGEVSVNYAS